MMSIIPGQHGFADSTHRRAVPRAMHLVDAALLERGGHEQLQANAVAIATAFLEAFHQARTRRVRHQLLTFPIPGHFGRPDYYRLCSCGFLSVPRASAAAADVEGCPVHEAEVTRSARVQGHHADRVIQALLQLSGQA